jgi:L-ascorbate metabolism protein UlaG (beta-lactamase superfamily)
MIITYLGGLLVKIQIGDFVAAFNPTSTNDEGKPIKFGADLALISAHDERYNNVDAVTYGAKVPFVIDGPGEYEVSDVYISGFPLGQTTAYLLILENMRILHIGAPQNANLTSELKEQAGEVDVLLVPVGDKTLVSAHDAAKIATFFAPHIIIPLHFGKKATAGSDLSTFLKEVGASQSDFVEKLVIKRKDIETKDGEVILIES